MFTKKTELIHVRINAIRSVSFFIANREFIRIGSVHIAATYENAIVRTIPVPPYLPFNSSRKPEGKRNYSPNQFR